LCKLSGASIGPVYAVSVSSAAGDPGSGTVPRTCAEISRRQFCSKRSITRCTGYTPLFVFLKRLAEFVRKRTDANRNWNGDGIGTGTQLVNSLSPRTSVSSSPVKKPSSRR
jgi:hypothetical protein